MTETTVQTRTDEAKTGPAAARRLDRPFDARSIAIGLATALLVGATTLVGKDAGAEEQYLALLSVAVLGLTTPSALAGERWRLLTWYVAALLTAVATLALPAGPVRGTGTSCALLIALAATIPTRREAHLQLLLIPSAVALQLVLRSSTLLAPEVSVHTLVVWVALPVTSAAAAWLALRHREPRVVAAALVSLLLACGGFTVTSTLAMWAAVLALEVAKPRVGHAWIGRVALAACLAAAGVWHWPTGLLLTALAVLLISRGLGFAVLLVVGGILAQSTEPRAWSAVAAEAPRVLMLLPFAAAAWALSLHSRSLLRDVRRLGGVALLTIVALRSLAPEAALAFPVLLVLITGPVRGSRHGAKQVKDRLGLAADLQTRWAGGLLGVAALCASYPWLRWPDFVRLFRLTGWNDPRSLWIAGAVAAGVAALIMMATAPPSAPDRRRAPWLLPVVTLLSLMSLTASTKAPSKPVHDWPPQTLATATPVRDWQVDGGLSRLYLHTALTNSTSLPAGTPVATATSLGPGGPLESVELRVGEHTGDWAAVTVESPAPTPWLYWVEPEGRFFGQRYRARMGWPEGASTLSVARHPGLPEDVEVVIYAITARR